MLSHNLNNVTRRAVQSILFLRNYDNPSQRDNLRLEISDTVYNSRMEVFGQKWKTIEIYDIQFSLDRLIYLVTISVVLHLQSPNACIKKATRY